MSTAIARSYNWVTDKNAGTPITASRMDTEFDAIITKLNQKVIIAASAPSGPIAGMLWLDSTNKLLKQYRNSEWVVMGCVHIATAAPTTAQEGDLFFNTTTHKIYVYSTSTAFQEIITSANWGTLGQMLVSSGGAGTAPTSLGFGTINQFLTSQGIGSAPQFKAFANVLGTAYVKNTDLKTATGEVVSTFAEMQDFALPGGEYGFYPQCKTSDGGDARVGIVANGTQFTTLGKTYVTTISFHTNSSGTLYAQQRYVTASGQDHWLFLLVDKSTKSVLAVYSAPDHPAYGNGGDFGKMPHPFGNAYDNSKHEIVLIDQDTVEELEKRVTFEKSLATVVMEEYKVDMDAEQLYAPLHSGKYLTKDNEQIRQMINTIPDYIKVRKMLKIPEPTEQDKLERKQRIEQRNLEKQRQEDMKRNKIKQKLGLSDQELAELREILK